MPVERFGSGGAYEDRIGYSRVVVARGLDGATAWTAGTTAMVDGSVRHRGDAHGQAVVAFQAALFALERAGFGRADAVRTRMYVRDLASHGRAVGRAHAEVLGDVRPAATMVGVEALIHPDMLVEVEVVAWRPGEGPAA